MIIAMALVFLATASQAIIGQTRDSRALCHTLYFILPNVVNQLINIVFLYVGLKITQAIKLYNKGQQSLVEGESEEKMPVLRVMQEIKFR